MWKDCEISTKEHFYHVGASENNRNAVYEALLSNFVLSESISNSKMRTRIDKDESQLTGKPKVYASSKQLVLSLDDEKTKYSNS